MLDNLLFAFGPFAMIAAGVIVLWVVGQQRDPGGGRDALTAGWRGVGWGLLLVGIFLVITFTAVIFAVVLWAAAVFVIVGTAVRYLSAERQSLLWVLAVAAERGIPLEAAARAFAGERNDVMGKRALMLADYLEAGVPLSLALRRSRCRVSDAALLAAELGERTGTLGVGLRKLVDDVDEHEATLRSLLERVFFLVFLLLFAKLVLTFLLLKIFPVFAKMLSEFELDLPVATRLLVSISDAILQGWFWFSPLIALIGVALVIGVLCYLGVSPRNFPVLRRLWWAADCALVMHWLALAVRHNLPLADMVRLLGEYFPQSSLRGRLERASTRIDRGADWCDALRQVRVFRRSESALFEAAQRAGNLAWALEEMADSGVRRSAYRIRAAVDLGFPVALLVFGAAVLFVILATFLPLVLLIEGLA